MPYIRAETRQELTERDPRNPGELNFLITMICWDYIRNNGRTYQHLNDVIGALTAAQLEFYRRVVAPYEEMKIEENGDIYEK